MKSMKELRENLTALFADVKSGAVQPEVASVMNNTAGKIIKSCAVQLAYKELTKSDAPIEFLEG